MQRRLDDPKKKHLKVVEDFVCLFKEQFYHSPVSTTPRPSPGECLTSWVSFGNYNEVGSVQGLYHCHHSTSPTTPTHRKYLVHGV